MFQLYSFIICHVLENIDEKYEMTFVDIDELVMALREIIIMISLVQNSKTEKK